MRNSQHLTYSDCHHLIVKPSTHRQTRKQENGQKCRQACRNADRFKDRHTHMQTCRHTGMHADKQPQKHLLDPNPKPLNPNPHS